MLVAFRWISLAEGLSLLTLLGLAMPLRAFGVIDLVWPVGMAHGVLWLVYVVATLAVSHARGWSVWAWLLSLLCSVLPFGFVLMDLRVRRELAAAVPAAA
jgi:integral membrane protein